MPDSPCFGHLIRHVGAEWPKDRLGHIRPISLKQKRNVSIKIIINNNNNNPILLMSCIYTHTLIQDLYWIILSSRVNKSNLKKKKKGLPEDKISVVMGEMGKYIWLSRWTTVFLSSSDCNCKFRASALNILSWLLTYKHSPFYSCFIYLYTLKA